MVAVKAMNEIGGRDAYPSLSEAKLTHSCVRTSRADQTGLPQANSCEPQPRVVLLEIIFRMLEGNL